MGRKVGGVLGRLRRDANRVGLVWKHSESV